MKAEEIHSKEELFEAIDRTEATAKEIKAPLIGVSANILEENSAVRFAYTQSIMAAGGIPVILPIQTDLAVLLKTIERLDGLVITGGGDISAEFLNEIPHPNIGSVSKNRDIYDLSLIRLATERQMPLLCICRGHQLLNVAMGGTLWQDIVEQCNLPKEMHSQTEARETPTHLIRLEKDSFLSGLLEKDVLKVNSFHHQAIRTVAPGFKAVAQTEDGINEAIEPLVLPQRIISVQWHPEAMAASDDFTMMKLFKNIVDEAALYRTAHYLHDEIISLDSHCDTPMKFTPDFNLGLRQKNALVDLVKMQEGKLDAICMAAYLPQGKRNEQALQRATERATQILRNIHLQVETNHLKAGIASSKEDIFQLKKEGKKAILPCIENGYALGKDLSNIAHFKKMGVVYITLCHNGDNDICDSAKGEEEHNGLSMYGCKVINEMNHQGIIIDLSHASEKTFWDVLNLSEAPVIVSHSSAKALCNHRRNLSDEQIKALAAKGGVIQLCLYGPFLSSENNADINTIIRHIDHIVNLVGIDYVGIGSDFDGDGGVPGCENASQLMNITIELLRKNYSPEDIKKLWGENFLRVLKAVREVADTKDC
ncbi:MAG: gamma-glutamyl-gamma-aminobutyrate hydrolase family protein [Bacteroidales bacterium]|nr:gamma-glutamyl-gamma-aminobutyrate hydrolase family protein [Bacteroidales bacterium]